ncbi:MAG: zinc-ribbon domain-containing protein, partial [Pseudodesulfovibrio sp.]
MIVTCPNCQTKYNLPDAKVPPGGAKVKCSKCAHVFKAEPPSTPEEEVENLFEEESAAPDTSAGDAFDETFDEVASGRKDSVGGVGDADMDDLFGDGGDEAGGDADAGEDAVSGGSDDVDSLFGDDDDLFAADEPETRPKPKSKPVQEDSEGADDLFATGDDDDAGDLFASGDEEEEDDEDEDEDEDGGGLDLDDDEPVRSRKPLGCLITLLILVLLVGGAVWFKAWRWFGLDVCSYIQNVPYVGKLCMEETGGDREAAPGESPADRVRNIVLKNVKQYYVANEKTGNLFVVEGKAVNQFTTPKERIK